METVADYGRGFLPLSKDEKKKYFARKTWGHGASYAKVGKEIFLLFLGVVLSKGNMAAGREGDKIRAAWR